MSNNSPKSTLQAITDMASSVQTYVTGQLYFSGLHDTPDGYQDGYFLKSSTTGIEYSQIIEEVSELPQTVEHGKLVSWQCGIYIGCDGSWNKISEDSAQAIDDPNVPGCINTASELALYQEYKDNFVAENMDNAIELALTRGDNPADSIYNVCTYIDTQHQEVSLSPETAWIERSYIDQQTTSSRQQFEFMDSCARFHESDPTLFLRPYYNGFQRCRYNSVTATVDVVATVNRMSLRDIQAIDIEQEQFPITYALVKNANQLTPVTSDNTGENFVYAFNDNNKLYNAVKNFPHRTRLSPTYPIENNNYHHNGIELANGMIIDLYRADGTWYDFFDVEEFWEYNPDNSIGAYDDMGTLVSKDTFETVRVGDYAMIRHWDIYEWQNSNNNLNLNKRPFLLDTRNTSRASHSSSDLKYVTYHFRHQWRNNVPFGPTYVHTFEFDESTQEYKQKGNVISVENNGMRDNSFSDNAMDHHFHNIQISDDGNKLMMPHWQAGNNASMRIYEFNAASENWEISHIIPFPFDRNVFQKPNQEIFSFYSPFSVNFKENIIVFGEHQNDAVNPDNASSNTDSSLPNQWINPGGRTWVCEIDYDNLLFKPIHVTDSHFYNFSLRYDISRDGNTIAWSRGWVNASEPNFNTYGSTTMEAHKVITLKKLNNTWIQYEIEGAYKSALNNDGNFIVAEQGKTVPNSTSWWEQLGYSNFTEALQGGDYYALYQIPDATVTYLSATATTPHKWNTNLKTYYFNGENWENAFIDLSYSKSRENEYDVDSSNNNYVYLINEAGTAESFPVISPDGTALLLEGSIYATANGIYSPSSSATRFNNSIKFEESTYKWAIVQGETTLTLSAQVDGQCTFVEWSSTDAVINQLNNSQTTVIINKDTSITGVFDCR